MCGGFGFINMFHTDNTTIEGSNCGNTTEDTYYQKWFGDMGHCGIINGTLETGKLQPCLQSLYSQFTVSVLMRATLKSH